MNTDFSKIETILAKFNAVDNAPAVHASLAWSFAMSAAQTMIRLARIGDQDDPTYSEREKEELEAEAIRFEIRLDQFGELLAYFAKEANPEWMPNGAQVAKLVQEEFSGDRNVDEGTLETYAEEFGCGVDDLKIAMKKNEERFKKEALLQIDRAKLMADYIEKTVDSFISNCYDTPAEVDQRDAIRIADKVANKASQYASNRLAAALRQTRKRRRDAMNADRRLLLTIEEDADKLLTELEHERDAAFLEIGAEAV